MTEGANTAAGGAAWMVAARMAERALGLASTMVLARLLMPADFGLVAMAMVFVAAADVLGAFGLDWALVRQPNLQRSHLDTAWTIRAGLGVVSMVVLLALAWPAAQYYRDPRIAPMVLFLGVTLLVGALENPGVVMFRREMNFAKEFRIRTAAKVAGAAVAITGALLFRSYWALLLGTLASRGTSTLASYWLHPHRPRVTLAARAELMSFSMWLWVGNLLSFLRLRIVQLILGRTVGPGDLGLYTVAGEFADLASTELAAPINRALFSAYVRNGTEPERVGAAYLEAAPVIFLVTLPVVIGTLLTAPQVIYLLLGAQWASAVPLLEILCFAGMAGLLTTGSLHVYWAVGQPRLETLIECVWVVVLIGSVLWLTPTRGVEGAAWATLLSSLCVAPVNLYFLRRYAKVSLRASFARSWRTVVASSLMYLVVASLMRGKVPTSSAEALAQFGLAAVVGVAVYAVAGGLLWFVSGRPEGPETTILRVARRRLGRAATEA